MINNGSHDETSESLKQHPWIQLVSNETNQGCARAWNQGVDASPDAVWRIFLNNDVLLPNHWLEGLLDSAESLGLDIACPAMRAGPMNYSFEERASFVMTRMGAMARTGMAHGVCFAVRNTVFQKIGRFDESFRVGQFEDTDFSEEPLSQDSPPPQSAPRSSITSHPSLKRRSKKRPWVPTRLKTALILGKNGISIGSGENWKSSKPHADSSLTFVKSRRRRGHSWSTEATRLVRRHSAAHEHSDSQAPAPWGHPSAHPDSALYQGATPTCQN